MHSSCHAMSMVLTIDLQIQERHVGEDLERDGSAMEGGRSNALANRRSRNGSACQRSRLPPRWSTKREHHIRCHARQQIQHLSRFSFQRPSTHSWTWSRPRILSRTHSQPQPPSSLAPDARFDITRASPHGSPQQRCQLAWSKLFAKTQSRQRTVMPERGVHTSICSCTATFGRNHHAAI